MLEQFCRIDLNATNELGAVLVSEQIKAGVLVPVKPDQDSAIIALLSPATVKAIGVSMSYNQAKALVRVVLVGAGIGDTDE